MPKGPISVCCKPSESFHAVFHGAVFYFGELLRCLFRSEGHHRDRKCALFIGQKHFEQAFEQAAPRCSLAFPVHHCLKLRQLFLSLFSRLAVWAVFIFRGVPPCALPRLPTVFRAVKCWEYWPINWKAAWDESCLSKTIAPTLGIYNICLTGLLQAIGWHIASDGRRYWEVPLDCVSEPAAAASWFRRDRLACLPENW